MASSPHRDHGFKQETDFFNCSALRRVASVVHVQVERKLDDGVTACNGKVSQQKHKDIKTATEDMEAVVLQLLALPRALLCPFKVQWKTRDGALKCVGGARHKGSAPGEDSNNEGS